ncbi:MAG: substrate-binding domain-containing protein [Kiritimatiellae bacterium]|nr:substrate-binding domain-containing protein [Kiritimatiellia bacterium]
MVANAVKQHQIATQLAARIERGLYADRIPGEVALAAEFAVNVKTANKAVTLLVQDGLVQRRAGQGTFVVRKHEPVRMPLAMALYKYRGPEPDPLYVDLFQAVNEAAKALNCTVELSTPGHTRPPAGLTKDERILYHRNAFLDEIRAGAPRGVIYCGNPDEWLLGRLREFGPVIQIFKTGDPAESFVRRDPADGIRQAVHALHAAGRRRIAYVTYASPESDLKQKAEGYRTACERLGLDYRLQIEDRFPAKPDCAERFFEKAPHPDACVCSESTIGRAVLAGLVARGTRIPQEMALWSYDDACSGLYTVPQMNGIRVFDAEIGRLAAQALVDVLDGRRRLPVQDTLPAVLAPRQTG